MQSTDGHPIDDDPWAALRIIDAHGPADERLVALVRWIDLTFDDDATSAKRQLFARAVVAAGKLLVQHLRADAAHPVARTLTAAEAYVSEPTEGAYDAYVAAATASYPFGPGDGCYSLPGDEPHGTRGTGCVSGAGTLYQIGLAVGPDAVMAALAAELPPWLRTLRG